MAFYHCQGWHLASTSGHLPTLPGGGAWQLLWRALAPLFPDPGLRAFVLSLLNLRLGDDLQAQGFLYWSGVLQGKRFCVCWLAWCLFCVVSNLLEILPCLILGRTPLELRQSLKKLCYEVNILSDKLFHVLSYLEAFFFLDRTQINNSCSARALV